MRRAFTIVEMLVVMMIVAALMAVLLPSLSAVRGKGHNLTCLTSLRTLGQAVSMYRHDSDDDLPFAAYYPSVFTTSIRPFDVLASYLEAPLPTPDPVTGAAQTSTPWACPTDEVWAPGSGFSYHYTPTSFFQVLPEPTVQAVFQGDINAAIFVEYLIDDQPHRNAVRLDGSVDDFNGRTLLRAP